MKTRYAYGLSCLLAVAVFGCGAARPGQGPKPKRELAAGSEVVTNTAALTVSARYALAYWGSSFR